MEIAERRLEAARYLYQGEYNEAAITRTYFALFAAAKGLLLTKDVEPKTHKGLNAMLGLHFVKRGALPIEIVAILSRLQERREACDYDMQLFSPALARQSIEEAERAINRIDALVS